MGLLRECEYYQVKVGFWSGCPFRAGTINPCLHAGQMALKQIQNYPAFFGGDVDGLVYSHVFVLMVIMAFSLLIRCAAQNQSFNHR